MLVVGATEEQVTLLAEVDSDAVDAALRERRGAGAVGAAETRSDADARRWSARSTSGALAGSVFDRNGWGSFVTSSASARSADHDAPCARSGARGVSTRRRAALVLLFALLCTVAAVLLAGPASAAPTDPVAPTAPDRTGRAG